MYDISFCSLEDEDYSLLSDWRNSPEVREWYYDYDDPERVYSPEYMRLHHERKANENPRIGQYMIALNGVKAGFVQCYLLSDYPEYENLVQTDEETAAVDIFLAPSYMHKGHGSKIMRTLLNDIVFNDVLFHAEKCMIGPEPSNISAIKMYQKVGFTYWKTVQIPGEQEPEYLMLLHKNQLQGNLK